MIELIKPTIIHKKAEQLKVIWSDYFFTKV